MINFIKNLLKRKPLKIEPCAMCGGDKLVINKIPIDDIKYIVTIFCNNNACGNHVRISPKSDKTPMKALKEWNEKQREKKCLK